jgi:two-component system chemotaxis sensor kinase CheA
VNTLPGYALLYRLREYNVPVVRLSEAFGVTPHAQAFEDGLLIIVDSERQRYGIWVDDLLDQQQVVIKSLKTNFVNVEGVSGATILGDGTVSLILDVTGIINLTNSRNKSARLAVA